MKNPIVAALAVSLALSACDLPTNADEARDHLGRDQVERIVPIQLPMPAISVTLADQLGALSGIVDTTDLSFSVAPDTFAFGLDSLLTIDPVDPAPVTQGYVLAVADFTRDINVSLPAVPITLPSEQFQFPLIPFPTGTALAFGMDMSATFATATFAAGAALEVVVTTDATASLTDVDAELQDGDGAVLATSSNGPLTVGGGATETLSIPLDGVALPGAFNLVLSFSAGSGDGTDDELTLDVGFANAEVTAATGVDAAQVTPVTFDQSVTLDQAGSDFSEATLAAGNVAVTSFSSGTLEFTPTFSGDLSGLQIGGATPDQLMVSGQVGADPAATTVDITNSADLTVTFSGLEVETVTLGTVTMSVTQTVAVETGGGQLESLSEVSIGTGFLELAVDNRLDVTGDITLTLNGLTDSNGDVVTTTFTLAPSTDGLPETTFEIVDLANTTLDPSALEAVVTGDIGGTDVVVTPAAAAEAIVIDPYLEVNPRSVVLGETPDLNVALDENVPIATGDIDLGQLGDLLDKIVFNDVTFTVTIDNGTGMDVQLDGFGMTLLDGTGAPVTDGAGNDVAVVLSNDEAGTSVHAPASAATVVTGDASVFVNELLDRVAASEDISVAARGTMGPGAGGGTIALGDSVSVIFEIALGPDISIDPTGITLDQVVHEALSLDSVAATFLADLSEDLVSASVEFEAVNGMPLGFSISMALATTPEDTTGFDPFSATDRLEIPAVVIGAATVDSEGRVSAPITSVDTASVVPAELAALDGALSLGMSAAILGPPGDRAQLQPTDSLVIKPFLRIEVRVSGNGGTE